MSDTEKLREVEAAFQTNEIAFNAACKAFKAHLWPTSRVKIGNTVNIQTERPNSEGQRILRAVQQTTAQRNVLLLERAKLRKSLGL